MISSHDVNVETIQFKVFPHIFLFYVEADQHENVRQEVVCKRRGFTSVVELTSSLFDWPLECFATIVQSIDLYTQRACEVGEVNSYL